MSPLLTWALVLGAGVVGALLRHGAVVRFGRGERFPVVILVVNATGSLLAGALAGLAFSLPAPWLAILATGFCGALTTFSTFSVDTVRLALAGRGWAALGNVLGSIALGLGCAALGAAIALAVV